MIIYNYNPSTGEYIGTGEAKESPREPGEFFNTCKRCNGSASDSRSR